jgi:ABC-type polysaccharide/polyol phosphate transport system ATPase subunit
MAEIIVDNVSLKLIKQNNSSNSIKESVVKYILNFGKSSYKAEDFWVLNECNFSLKTGDRLGIIGVNGAGKSTLLKVMTGIYPITKGKVTTNGRVSSLIEIGAGFDAELTGRENILLNGLLSGFTRKEVMACQEEIIEFSGLREFIDTPIKYYSTGMGMRLGFSIATNINPEILIVDELFAGGDINFINKATKRLDHIIDHSDIFITCSHDSKYLKNLCNKVLYIKDRHIAYFGSDVKGAIAQYEADNK